MSVRCDKKLFIWSSLYYESFFCFVASKGHEAINIRIAQRQLKNIYELPKIPKKTKENVREQTDISVDVFKSTMFEIIPFFLTLLKIYFVSEPIYFAKLYEIASKSSYSSLFHDNISMKIVLLH